MKIEPRRALYMAVCCLTGATEENIRRMCADDEEAMQDVSAAVIAIGAHLYEAITEKWTKDGAPEGDYRDVKT